MIASVLATGLTNKADIPMGQEKDELTRSAIVPPLFRALVKPRVQRGPVLLQTLAIRSEDVRVGVPLMADRDRTVLTVLSHGLAEEPCEHVAVGVVSHIKSKTDLVVLVQGSANQVFKLLYRSH